MCRAKLETLFSSVSGIAGVLSLAADHCADTMIPNKNALCAGAVSGIVSHVARLSGSTALVTEACDPTGIADLSEDAVSSNLRSSQALHTQCDIRVTSVAWLLAQVGLAINAAVDPKAVASCDVQGNGGSQALCIVDAVGAISAFGEAVQYLKLTAAHCSDQFGVKTMCGAAINSTVSTFAGMQSSSSVLRLACRDYRGDEDASGFVDFVADNLAQQPVSLEQKLAELRARFSSPGEVWKSIGYDLDDQHAGFRSMQPYRPAIKDVVSLVEGAELATAVAAKAISGDLFSSAQVCS